MMAMSKIGFKLFLVILIMSTAGLIITAFVVNYRIEHHFQQYVYRQREQEVKELVNVLEQNYQGNWQVDSNLLNRYVSGNRLIIFLFNKEGDLLYTNYDTPGSGRRQNDFALEEANEQILYDNNQEIGYLYWQLPGRQRMDEITPGNHFIGNVNRAVFLVTAVMVILAILVGFFLSRYLTSPLLKMNKMTAAIAGGNYDVRVKIRGDDELNQLANSLNRMTVRLKYLEKAKEESAGDLVHELRTPLSIIANYLTAIKDGVFRADSAIIGEMTGELSRMEKLVSRLEELSETEQKLIYMDKQDIDLKKILKQAVTNFKKEAATKEVKLRLNIKGDNFVMFGDEDGLKTVFNNLIANAVKYSLQGGKVTVSLLKDKQQLVVRVKDEGIGIPQKDLPYIFERFYRTDKSRSTKTGGTGLGLTIVRKLIKAHDGEIRVSSDSKGTVFTVVFSSTELEV